MKLLRTIAFLTLISIGASSLVAQQPAANQPRDLVARAAKLKHNGALHHLIKKAAAKKTHTKTRQEKCHTDLDRKKMLYSVIFACLICNIPSILAQTRSSDKTSDNTQIALNGTQHQQPSTCIQIAENMATITHIRPNGLVQKCNVIDNERVICTLSNPHNGKSLCHEFSLTFNGTCKKPAVGPQTFNDTKMLQELQNATAHNQLEIGPNTTQLTHQVIQELLTHVKVNVSKIRLEKDLYNAYLRPLKHELVLGTAYLEQALRHDAELIFALAHEIGHGTQQLVGIDKKIDKFLTDFKDFFYISLPPIFLNELAAVELISLAKVLLLFIDLTSKYRLLNKMPHTTPREIKNHTAQFLSLLQTAANTILMVLFSANIYNLAVLRAELSLEPLSVMSALQIIIAIKALSCLCNLSFKKINFKGLCWKLSELAIKSGWLMITPELIGLLQRFKFSLPDYRSINSEINADLLSFANSENTYQYNFAMGDYIHSQEIHPADPFRCAYIQEFIRKYQELLTWFQAHQRFIE